MPDRVGQQLGNYRLIRLLGHGGYADVYLGEHVYLKTLAAIKVLQMQLGGDERNHFLDEARTIAHLVHPHIIRVLDFGVDGNVPFLVMDYARNGSLRERHPRGTRLPLATVITYVKQVAEALQYAHNSNLVHRDVKPANMLLGAKDEVLLSDFGIALVAQSSQSQSTQDTIGTIAYMAPEQIEGKPRPASDQYSLGIVVYEWLCGERPFHGSLPEVVSQQMAAMPPSLHEKVPSLSQDVEEAVMMALAKDPHQRFDTVMAFAHALEQADQNGKPETNFYGELRPISSPPSSFSPKQSGAAPPTSIPPTQPALILPAPTPSMQSGMAQQQQYEMRPQEKTSREVERNPGHITESPRRDRIYPGDSKKHATGGRNLMRQFIGMIIGVLLYGGLGYIIDTLNVLNPQSNLPYRLYYLAIIVPLFFGAILGPWAGIVTALGGYLLGHYFAGTSELWNNGLGIAITGFIAGLAMLRTRGRYNSLRAIGFAELFGAMGILLGEGFTDCSNIWVAKIGVLSSAADFFTFSFFELLCGLIALPILLGIYNLTIGRKRQQPET